MIEKLALIGNYDNDPINSLADAWAEKLSAVDNADMERFAEVYIGEKKDEGESRRTANMLLGTLAVGGGLALGLGGKNGVIRNFLAKQKSYAAETANLRGLGKTVQEFIDVDKKSKRDAFEAMFPLDHVMFKGDKVKQNIVMNTYRDLDGLTKGVTSSSPEVKEQVYKHLQSLKGNVDLPVEALDSLIRKWTPKEPRGRFDRD